MRLKRLLMRVILRGHVRRALYLDRAHRRPDGGRVPLLDFDAWLRRNGGRHW